MDYHQDYSRPATAARPAPLTHTGTDPFSLLRFCFFLSGVSALIYEIGWLGRVQVLVGSTVLGLALTLSAYLSGLAAGSWGAAMIAPQTKHPLRWYFICESLVAVWGLFFSPLMNLLEGHSSFSASLGALLSIFVPTVFLGASLPFLLAWVNARSRLSALYSANAAGAALGSLVAAVVVLPQWGFSGAMIFAALLNGAVVIIGSQLRPQFKSMTNDDLMSRVKGASQQRNTEQVRSKSLTSKMCLLALFGTGVLSFCTQLIWNRLGALVVGPTVYLFPLVVCVILSGIALGSHFLSRLQKLPFVDLSLGLAGSLLWSFALLSHGAIALFWFHGLWPDRAHAVPFLIKFAFEFLYFVLACGPASLLSGCLFPHLAGLLSQARHDKSGSRSTGIAGAISVGGGLFGSLVFSLLVLPRWGIGGASLLLYAMALLPAAGRVVAWFLPRGTLLKQQIHFRPLVLQGALLVFSLVAPQFIFPFDQRLLTSGTFYNRHGHLGQSGIGYTSSGAYLREKAEDILAVEDDSTALVSVHENGMTKQRFFKINGKVDGSTGEDVTTTQLVAEIPFLLREPEHPLRRVLTIGLGTGNTHAHVLKFNEVQNATVVELSPAVSKFAKSYFSNFNDKFYLNPKSLVVEGDGRKYLSQKIQQQRGQYDLIISEPSNPWVAGQSSLFTVEYYRLISQNLAPHGLASLWFHSYGLGCESVTSILKAISQVFPSYLVFQEGGDYFVVASAQQKELRVHDVNEVSGFQKNWYGIFQASTLDGFLTSRLYFDEKTMQPALRNAVANSDDNQLLQYDAGQTFYRDLQCSELENYRTPEPTKFNAKMDAWEKRIQAE